MPNAANARKGMRSATAGDLFNLIRPEPKYYENDYVRGFRTCFRNFTFLK